MENDTVQLHPQNHIPAADAAADAHPLHNPIAIPQPEQPEQQQRASPDLPYHAIRHGRNVRNCIFVSWEDAQVQVLDYDKAEYSSFASIEDALEYIRHSGHSGHSGHSRHTNHRGDDVGSEVLVTDQTAATAATTIPIGDVDNGQTVLDATSETVVLQSNNGALLEAMNDQNQNHESSAMNTQPNSSQDQTFDEVDDEVDDNELDDEDEEEDDDNLPIAILKSTFSSTASSAAAPQTVAATSTSTSTSATHANKRKHDNDNLDIIHTATTRKRIRLPRETETIQIDGRTVHKRRPSKNWMAMFRKLQAYRNKHGSFQIGFTNNNNGGDDHDDEDHLALKRWISDQKHQYKCYKTGKKHYSSQMKRKLLQTIGFDFEFHPFDEKIEQLKQYKLQHGKDAPIPKNHPELGSWMEAQKRQLFFYNKGKDSKLSQDQVQKLKEVGVDVKKVSKPDIRPRQETSEHVKKWDEMFQTMEEYKKVHGHCQVPKSDGINQLLYKWVCQQRLEYKKLKNDQGNKMTASRLQKLNDLGFNFNPRSAYLKWDDRMKQLQEFKDKHGHLRVPVSDPDIGEFVARQRVEYAKLMDGKSCNITQQRVNDLTQLGFVFQVGKRRVNEVKVVRKTWDERFHELMEYKETHGHCLVPQSCSLGEWVHKQRKMYKMLKNGKSCSLTTERALKLADVGFVFDASGYRRGRKVVEETINVVPMPVAQMPTVPDPYHEHMANLNMTNM